MQISEAPVTPKWPFIAADVLLVAGGCALGYFSHQPFDGLTGLALAGCFAAGGWILATPFLRDHAAAVKLFEQANLAAATEQLNELATMARQVEAATRHWQAVQESAARTESAAREVAAKAGTEVTRFAEILTRGDQQEKQALRFELDKLRRGEAEMLQVLVHMLDHVHALNAAGARSGQPQLTRQLANFRTACLDTARRVGLVAFEAQPGEAFNPQAHQTVDGQEPAPGHVVAATVACGYTFQGQGLRRILVATVAPGDLPAPPAPQEAATMTFSMSAPAESLQTPVQTPSSEQNFGKNAGADASAEG
jgi:molecular chaperone GrpE (heat shock protein)